MARIHLFEIGDQEWCPRIIRDYFTDYLRYFENLTHIYKDAAPIIEKGLASASERKIIDLCSGASGPWSRLVEEVTNVEVLLTDLYPNKPRMSAINDLNLTTIKYCESPVDASNVETSYAGLRTLFSGFHHFKPSQAESILKDAVNKNEPIAVFEFTERTTLNLFIEPVVVTLAVLITTIFIKPRKITRYLFTYLIPIIPLMVVWDGYVSNLRTYSVQELAGMIKNLDADHYDWETGLKKTKHPGINLTYLLGRPKSRIKLKPKQKTQTAVEEALA